MSSSMHSLIVSIVAAVETLSALKIKDNLIDLHFMKNHYKLEPFWALLLFKRFSKSLFLPPNFLRLLDVGSHSKRV